jgi:phage shock protein A
MDGLHSSGMAFRWFRRRPAPAPDPIAAYDDLVSDLSAEAAELRRAAATLLTVRARLGRELAAIEEVGRTLRDRADRARAAADRRSQDVLGADVEREERRATGLREELARTESDVEQLEEAARRVAGQVDQLRSERDLAAARFTAGTALASEALRSRADRVRRLVAVDAARDEVERAHALAEVWREDSEGSDEGKR